MSTAIVRADAFTEEQIEVIKRSIAPKASDDELKLFLAICQRTGLDPFTRQIYSIRRRTYNQDTRQYEEQSVTQIGIDGARLIAERSGKYEGQEGPYWCGPDGAWFDVWLKKEPPVAAKVLIYKRGARVPTTGIAHWSEYCQTTKDGKPTRFWSDMPAAQLAKCAESNGLRRAFPQELAGVHVEDDAEAGDYIETTGRVISRDTGEIIAPPKQIEQKAEPPPTPPTGTQSGNQSANGNGQSAPEPAKASAATLKRLHALGHEVYGAEWDAKRHELIGRVSKGRTTSSADLTADEAAKLIAGIEAKRGKPADPPPPAPPAEPEVDFGMGEQPDLIRVPTGGAAYQ